MLRRILLPGLPDRYAADRAVLPHASGFIIPDGVRKGQDRFRDFFRGSGFAAIGVVLLDGLPAARRFAGRQRESGLKRLGWAAVRPAGRTRNDARCRRPGTRRSRPDRATAAVGRDRAGRRNRVSPVQATAATGNVMSPPPVAFSYVPVSRLRPLYPPRRDPDRQNELPPFRSPRFSPAFHTLEILDHADQPGQLGCLQADVERRPKVGSYEPGCSASRRARSRPAWSPWRSAREVQSESWPSPEEPTGFVTLPNSVHA